MQIFLPFPCRCWKQAWPGKGIPSMWHGTPDWSCRLASRSFRSRPWAPMTSWLSLIDDVSGLISPSVCLDYLIAERRLTPMTKLWNRRENVINIISNPLSCFPHKIVSKWNSSFEMCIYKADLPKKVIPSGYEYWYMDILPIVLFHSHFVHDAEIP